MRCSSSPDGRQARLDEPRLGRHQGIPEIAAAPLIFSGRQLAVARQRPGRHYRPVRRQNLIILDDVLLRVDTGSTNRSADLETCPGLQVAGRQEGIIRFAGRAPGSLQQCRQLLASGQNAPH